MTKTITVVELPFSLRFYQFFRLSLLLYLVSIRRYRRTLTTVTYIYQIYELSRQIVYFLVFDRVRVIKFQIYQLLSSIHYLLRRSAFS